jgi:carboxyl-terminal processing protease
MNGMSVRMQRGQAVRSGLILMAVVAIGFPARLLADRYEPSENLERFEKVWRTTRENFYDPKMHGLDWRAIGDKYRPLAEGAKTKREFQQVVNDMLNELRASHMGYLTDDDMESYLLRSLFSQDTSRLQMEHIGVMGEPDKTGAFVVRALLDGGPAAAAGVRFGDRLLDVEGEPFSTVGAFKGRTGRTTRITLDRPGVGRKTIDVTPVRENPQKAFLNATEKSVRILEHKGSRIGYIHLWTMTDASFRQALESALVGKLNDTDGLILDLRDGFGGHPDRFTDVLFRPDVAWSSTYRNRRSAVSHNGYSKPVVFLINRGTRSAKESFAYQVKKAKRGLLVGTTTAGAFLGAGGFPISEEGYLELPVVDLTLDGNRLEGVGVAPDVVVEAGDAYGPNDKQLAKGLEVLMSKLRTPAP